MAVMFLESTSHRPYETCMSLLFHQKKRSDVTAHPTMQDYSHLNDVGKGVHTLLQGAIHTGQFRTWDKFNLWLGLGQRVSIAVKAKRADLASEPKPGKGKEIDIHAMTGLTFPKGSWVVRSNEEYDGWNQSHRGVADSTYIGDLYSTATEEATVHFDWTSTAGPDSQVSDQVSMYREYQQDIDRSNEFAQSSGRSRIMDTDPDLPEYQKRQQKMKMDRGMDFAYSSQYNHHAFLWDNKTDGS